ncbi:MAG TPA: glycosyltransferase family 1 protein, partial [Actinomycetota bacterium]|nr:glycosyltransferase family 1 protein [Actinomycetota bacterium]
MKVAFAVDQLRFAVPGGIGTYVRELAPALRAEDPSLDLVPFAARWPDPPDRDVVELPGTIRTLYPRWALTGKPSLPAALGRCAVVHATNPAAVPPAAGGQALVVTVHDLAFDRYPRAFPPIWRWLYRAGVRAAIRRADVLLAPSAATAADLRDRGADPERIRVTPLAASLAAGTQDPEAVLGRLGIDRPYVLAPGTIEPRKNQVRLIRAYRQVAPDVPHALVLAGPDGWGVEEVDAEQARPGPGRIVRTGPLDAADLDAVYRGADLVAYVSLYEGFGLPVVEAMARGVAVLGSTTPAVAETAGDAALLVDPEDVADIADGLARVLADERL